MQFSPWRPYPTFDLNSPRELDEFSLSKLEGYTKGTEEYTSLYYSLLYNMWSNKTVTGLYEPGSTFKVITSCMAFEENVVTENDTFYCRDITLWRDTATYPAIKPRDTGR